MFKEYMLVPKGVHCKSSNIYFAVEKAWAVRFEFPSLGSRMERVKNSFRLS